jgi:hypothetical protein
MSAQGAKKTAAKRMVTKQVKDALNNHPSRYYSLDRLVHQEKAVDFITRMRRTEPRQQRILERFFRRIEHDYYKNFFELCNRLTTTQESSEFIRALYAEVEETMEPYK